MLRVWARDGDLYRAGTLKALAGRVLLKRTGVGGFRLEVDASTSAARAFSPGWGVIVQEDDQFLFSGPVTKIRREFTGGSHLLVLEGETDAHQLRDRDVYPDPSQDSATQTTVSHWTRTDIPGETIVADLVNSSVGASALSFRRFLPLQPYVSQGRGSLASISARWTKVLAEVQAVANTTGLVVDVGQTNPAVPALELLVRTPADLSRVVRFTPEKGLGDYWVEMEEPTTTVVTVGGGGQGTARSTWGLQVNEPWGGRRKEEFLDRRDTTDVGAYRRTAEEHGQETAEKAAAGFTITETARYRLGRDFLLGDVVSVYADEGEGAHITTGPVTSASLEWDGHGRKVELKVGENVAGSSEAPIGLERARKLERRLSRMEGGQ